MINKTIPLAIFVFLISCQQNQKHSIDGLKMVVMDYQLDGNDYIIKGHVNDNELIHGFAEVFTKSGKKQFEGTFDNGKINGLLKIFHEDGSKTLAQYTQGKIDGILIEYCPDGKTQSISLVKGGVYWYTREYHSNGIIDTTFRLFDLTYGTYKDNKLILTYRFEDPFFESGFIEICLANSVGRTLCTERIQINKCDSTVLSKPLNPGEYLSEIKFYSNQDNELLYKFVPGKKQE